MIIEGLVPESEVARALDALSTMTWQEGHSHHKDYKSEVKQNQELRKKDDIRLQVILDKFEKLIMKDRRFSQYAYPLKTSGLRFNRCKDGGFYGPHADSSIMQNPPIRSDLTVTLWLTDDYEGGEHVAEGVGSFKGKAGDVMIYPSYYVHEVKPVTSGERICAVMWVQSMIRDESQRNLLKRFYDFGVSLKEKEHLSRDYIEVTSLYNNLLRMWAAL